MIKETSILDRGDRVHQHRRNVFERELRPRACLHRIARQRFGRERKRIQSDFVAIEFTYSSIAIKRHANLGWIAARTVGPNFDRSILNREAAVPNSSGIIT